MENKKAFALILLVSTFLGAVGQVFFKLGVMNKGMLLAAYLALGLVAYGFSTVIYFYVLSRAHLSWTYGFTGLSYIFASIIAYLIGEHIPMLRWVGILIIAVGTALIGLS